MKTVATAAVAATLLLPAISFADSQATLPMDKRDLATTSGRDEATKEWLRSWHKGEVYATQAEYIFDANLATEKNEKPSGEWVPTWR